MESEKLSKDKNKDNQNYKSNVNLINIKSRYILSKIYNNLEIKKKLNIVRYNKKMQNRLNINFKDYKEFYNIDIEIITCDKKYGRFININEKDIYYHIYFNDNEKEIKNRYSIGKKDKVTKIKIRIDYQVKSFEKLFFNCICIKSINFKKFYRDNIECFFGSILCLLLL